MAQPQTAADDFVLAAAKVLAQIAPPKRSAEKKTRRVQLRVRPDTWAAFQRLAEANGYSANDYAERVFASFARVNGVGDLFTATETAEGVALEPAPTLAHAVPAAEDSPKAKAEPVHTWEIPDGLAPSHADLPEDAKAMLAGTLARIREKTAPTKKGKQAKGPCDGLGLNS